MERSGITIAEYLDDPTEPGGGLEHRVRLLTGGTDRTTPVGRRSVTVTCLTAATTGVLVDGEVVAEGASLARISDYPGNVLPEVTIETVPGDVAMVVEVFDAGEVGIEAPALLLEGGGYLLLEGGGHLLLPDGP